MKINVVVTTYNHEKYLAQCLESILSQKGDFQMEVIIGDDASTDNTRQIAEQYQAQYPGTVFLLPPEKNLGITKNLKRCLDACTGEYIAICEGDDYWTDVYKLQKQKDFLDEHADYSMCFCAFVILFEETGVLELHPDPLYLKQDFLTTEDLIERNSIGNFSCCMYRRQAVARIPRQMYELFFADWLFNMACGQFGRIGFIRDWMSVYRKHAHGAWAGKSVIENNKKVIHLIDQYNEFFEYKYDTQFMKTKAALERHVVHLQANSDSDKAMSWNHSLTDRVAEQERILQNIYAGRGWRLIQFLRRIRSWFLPSAGR